MNLSEILKTLKSLSNPEAVKGMARFGINPESAYGISIPKLRALAKQAGKDHNLAQKLWESGIHEARILACYIDIPADVTEEQMENWVKDFNSWDLCDQCCMNLFDKTDLAYQKAKEWSARHEEFVKRAGFALMASLALHDKKAPDSNFTMFLPIIQREADDPRNFVKKAVNWALRQIGKRNIALNKAAIQSAEQIVSYKSKPAKWIANDALKELTSENILKRLQKKATG